MRHEPRTGMPARRKVTVSPKGGGWARKMHEAVEKAERDGRSVRVLGTQKNFQA